MKTLLIIVLSILPLAADVERYKDEALYLARLTELGFATVQEDFEGSDWDGIRSTIVNPASATSITSKRIVWDSPAGDFYPYNCNNSQLATNTNWGRSGYGVYDTCLATTIRVTAPETIYGIAFWVDTNPDGQDVGILFPDRTTANEPGYLIGSYGAMYPGDDHPSGHGFIGFIDPAGFTSLIITGTLEVNEEGQLEGGTTWGADDFTFGVAQSYLTAPLTSWRTTHFLQADLNDPAKEATVWGTDADPDGDGLTNDAELALGTDPNKQSDRSGFVSLGTVESEGQTYVTLTYKSYSEDPALSIIPQISANLLGWNSGSPHFTTQSVIDQGNGYKLITVRSQTTITAGTKVFARIQVNRSGP